MSAFLPKSAKTLNSAGAKVNSDNICKKWRNNAMHAEAIIFEGLK